MITIVQRVSEAQSSSPGKSSARSAGVLALAAVVRGDTGEGHRVDRGEARGCGFSAATGKHFDKDVKETWRVDPARE
jgi:hypothetical protein